MYPLGECRARPHAGNAACFRMLAAPTPRIAL
jgi:hypothetical protein